MNRVIKKSFERKQKFKVIVLCLVCALFSWSCQTKGEYLEPLSEVRIYVEVENASKYSNIVEVKLMIYDISNVMYVELARYNWKDDGFQIIFPKTVDTKNLYPLIYKNRLQPTISEVQATLDISNENVNVCHALFWGVDIEGNVITPFFPFEIDENNNAKAIFCSYIDSNVTISGHTVRAGTAIDTEFHNELYKNLDLLPIWVDEIITSYSVNLPKGWSLFGLSRFYNEWTDSDGNTFMDGTFTDKWTTAPIKNMKWYGNEDLRYINF